MTIPTSPPPPPRRTTPSVLVLALTVLVTLAGCGWVGDRPAATAPTTNTTATPTTTTGGQGAADQPLEPARAIPYQQHAPLAPSPPARVEIPAIGVASDLVRLGLEPGGAMEVPTDYDLAGWFTEGPEPGQVGPAVIAGHVDSKSGPAIFYRLRDLQPGDGIRVIRADGHPLTFVVESVDQYPKTELPTEAVFGPVPWPALRLITCGGEFDHSRRSYRDNIVVSARLKGA